MLRNMKIGVKLITVGTLIMVLPLAIVAVLAVTKAGQGLEELEKEQMAARSKEIALLIDRVLEEEKKVVISLAARETVMNGMNAVAGKDESGSGEAVALLNAALAEIVRTKGLGEESQVIFCALPDGTAAVASQEEYIGKSFADRSYIREALEGRVNIGEIAQNKVTGKPFVPVAAPVYGPGGRVIGALANILDITFISELIATTRIGASGYAFVVDRTGLIIAHPKQEYIFKMNLLNQAGTSGFTGRMVAGQSGVDKYLFEGIAKTCGYAPVTGTGWSVGLTLPDREFLAPITAVRSIVLIVGGIFLVAAFLIYLLFSRSITTPLSRGVEFAQLVAAGDFTQKLDIRQQDEVGILATTLSGMSEKLRDMVLMIQESAEQVAGSSEEISSSAQQLATGAQNQASTLEETSASVEELTSSVEQVADHAQSQAASVEESSSNMTQMQASVQQVGKTLDTVSSSSQDSMGKAQGGAEAVKKAVEAIRAISAGSEQIAGIIGVIADIADQTNLLALNAAIEAARAGEHGRGFAVVADEVSKLADRSSASTKEIEKLIKESGRSVAAGVEIAHGALAAMEAIIEGAQKTNRMVEALASDMGQQINAIQEMGKATDSIAEMSQSISAATEQQTTNAKQVAQAIENVNELTQQAAGAAEEMSSATEELSSLAQQLQGLTAQFKVHREGEEWQAARGAGQTKEPVRKAPGRLQVTDGSNRGRAVGKDESGGQESVA